MKKVNTKRLKFKMNNTVVIAFAIVCVILLNVCLNLAQEKFPRMNFDLTKDSVTKLTDETKLFLNVIDRSETEIDIIYLKGTKDVDTITNDVLNQYDFYGENIDFRVENYHKNPALLNAFGIAPSQIMDGTVVVTNKDKTLYRMILPVSIWSSEGEFLLESKITNAIAYVAQSESVNVCFATGYGSDEYITNLIQSLVDDNITVSRIDLSTSHVPEEIDVLIIMDPYSDLTETEVASLEEYSLRGGSLIVALPSYAIALPNLETYLKYWGVAVNSDIIYEYDENSSYEQTGAGFFTKMGEHDITEGIKGRILSVNARSLNVTPTGDMEAKVLLSTTDKAVSVPQTEEEITKEDITYGPFDVGCIVERPTGGSFDKTSKLIVTSTPGIWGVESVENVIYQSRFGNREFISNAISYASGKSLNSVIVPRKASTQNVMAISTLQSAIFTLVLCFILPVAVLLCGLIVWLKRRNK